MGGDGSIKSEASDSCSALGRGFGLDEGVYWVAGKEVYCHMVADEDQHGTSLGETGGSKDTPAENCLGVLKHAQVEEKDVKTAIYWTKTPAGKVVETLCKFVDGKVAITSFDGTTTALAATSCKVIYDYFTEDNGVYWLKSGVGGAAQKKMCVDGEEGKLGDTENDPAKTCNQIKKEVKPAPKSGNYWIQNEDWPVPYEIPPLTPTYHTGIL